MTLAIGHREKDVTVVDRVREIPAPFDPESAAEEFVDVLKSYRLRRVIGDRYAANGARKRSKNAASHTFQANSRNLAYMSIYCRN